MDSESNFHIWFYEDNTTTVSIQVAVRWCLLDRNNSKSDYCALIKLIPVFNLRIPKPTPYGRFDGLEHIFNIPMQIWYRSGQIFFKEVETGVKVWIHFGHGLWLQSGNHVASRPLLHVSSSWPSLRWLNLRSVANKSKDNYKDCAVNEPIKTEEIIIRTHGKANKSTIFHGWKANELGQQ